MRVLAVDTSSDRGSVCLAEDGRILGEVRIASSLQQSERLFRSLELLLDYAPFHLSDVDVFAAARGPGSFTGLRVGLAAMEGFAAAHGKRGAGVSTLEALAAMAGGVDGCIAALIDARRSEVYAALYRRTDQGIVEERAPEVIALEQWLLSIPEGSVRFCGSGAERYAALLDRPQWAVEPGSLYLAPTVALLASREDCGPLSPLYVRKTDAEIIRDKHHESVTNTNQAG